MSITADLKEAETLCQEANDVENPSMQNEMILDALEIYSSICGVQSTHSFEDIEIGLVSLLENLPDEGLDYIARWRDVIPYFNEEKRAEVINLLVNFIRGPYLNDHEKIYTTTTLFNHKEYQICYKLFEEIATSEETQPKYQIEASKYLYYSELDEYIKLSQSVLLDIVSSDVYPSEWRLEQVMSFNTNTGVSTILNAGKLKFKPEPEFVYGLVNAFFYTEGNDPHDTVIAGQYILQFGESFLKLTGESLGISEEKLETIKNDKEIFSSYDSEGLKGDQFGMSDAEFASLLEDEDLFTDSAKKERELRRKYQISEQKLEDIQKMVHFCNVGKNLVQKYDLPSYSVISTIIQKGFSDFYVEQSDLDEIEEKLLAIGTNTSNDEDLRADAFDVIRRCGRQKERANDLIAQMGHEGKTGLELRGRNVYTNTQNIHFFGAEDAVERFVETIVHPAKKSEVQILTYNDAHSEVIDLIKRQIGKIVEDKDILKLMKEELPLSPVNDVIVDDIASADGKDTVSVDVDDRKMEDFDEEFVEETRRTINARKKYLALKAIRRISVDTALFTKYRMSMPDILIHIWMRIHTFEKEEQIEMKKRLMQELVDMGGESGGGTCSTGHAGRLINALDGKDASMKMSFGDQIQANISGRMNACIKNAQETDPDGYEKIASGCDRDADQEDKDYYFGFVESSLSKIKEEMRSEFVLCEERYLTEDEFEKFFEKGAVGWREKL